GQVKGVDYLAISAYCFLTVCVLSTRVRSFSSWAWQQQEAARSAKKKRDKINTPMMKQHIEQCICFSALLFCPPFFPPIFPQATPWTMYCCPAQYGMCITCWEILHMVSLESTGHALFWHAVFLVKRVR
ncbi:unnamed protein product, partial [Discosporangium mesarthrocarpum]